MKKLTSIFALLLSMIALMSLTSCEDQSIAYDLEGTWKGDMYMIRDGHCATYSEIEFYGDPFHFTSGSGKWLDVYSNYPGDYFCSRMKWKVSNGVIYISLLDDCDINGRPFELTIYDYYLDGDRFKGYIDYEGGSRQFSLYHTYSPHWEDYDYGYYDEYYYSKGSRSSNDSVPKVNHTHEMRQD